MALVVLRACAATLTLGTGGVGSTGLLSVGASLIGAVIRAAATASLPSRALALNPTVPVQTVIAAILRTGATSPRGRAPALAPVAPPVDLTPAITLLRAAAAVSVRTLAVVAGMTLV